MFRTYSSICPSFSPFTFALCFFFFNDTATTEIYTLSLHDALCIPVENRDPVFVFSRLISLPHSQRFALGPMRVHGACDGVGPSIGIPHQHDVSPGGILTLVAVRREILKIAILRHRGS